MPRAGDRIENAVTGERVTFRATSEETDGALMSMDYVAPAGFVIAPPHVHPLQEERSEVVSGTLSGRVGGRRHVLRAGGVAVVAPGVTHQWRNAGAGELHMIVEFRPALGTERLLERMFELAGRGGTNRRGLPAPLQMAVLLDAHCDEAALPVVPLGVQRRLWSALAAVGRRRGYRP